eukprot:638343-Rhodomonas_salina.1
MKRAFSKLCKTPLQSKISPDLCRGSLTLGLQKGSARTQTGNATDNVLIVLLPAGTVRSVCDAISRNYVKLPLPGPAGTNLGVCATPG